MSGKAIDLDEARGAAGFSKALLVLEEDVPTKLEVKDASFDQVLRKSDKKHSSSKVTIREDETLELPQISRGIPPPASSSSKAISDAIKETIANTIKSARVEQRSARRSDQSSNRPIVGKSELPSSARKRLPKNSDMKIESPEDSVKKEREKHDPNDPSKFVEDPNYMGEKDEHHEVDMKPRTDAEKHNYWKTRIQILHKQFPDVSLPKKSTTMTWQELRKIYYIEMDRCSIDKNVEAYKLAMIVMFFIVEGVGTKLFKVDISGFTVHSIQSLRRYDRLLIELGEKNYSGFAQNWPVELRLAGMIIFSAIVFALAKYIFKSTGQDMSEDFFNFFGNLGHLTVDAEPKPGAGMNAPSPNGPGGGGGLMGILGGLLGGGGGGLAGGLGGLDLGALFGGLMGGNKAAPTETQTETPSAPPDEAGTDGDDENRIKPPTYRRRKPQQ